MEAGGNQVIYMRLVHRLRRLLAEILHIGHQGNQNFPEFHIVLILRLNQRNSDGWLGQDYVTEEL